MNTWLKPKDSTPGRWTENEGAAAEAEAQTWADSLGETVLVCTHWFGALMPVNEISPTP